MKKITLILYILGNLLIADICFAESDYQLPNENNIQNSLKTEIIEFSDINPPDNQQKRFYTGNVGTKQSIPKNSENAEIILQETFDKYENKRVSEILDDSPALNASYGERGETAFYVRGFNQRQVPVLLDGVPIYVPFDGLIGLDRMNGANLQKITVVKSAPSIIYGPNTMGGVINIKTQKPSEPFKLKLRFDDNQVNRLNQDLYLGSKLDNNFYFSFNQSFSKSRGFNLSNNFKSSLNEDGNIRDNSDYHNLNMGGTIGYSSNDNQDYQLSYNSFSSPWNAPPEINVSKPRYWKFTEWKKNTAIFNFKQPVIQDKISLNGSVFYDKYLNVLDSYDDIAFSSQDKPFAFHSTYDDYSTGFNFIPRIIINKYVTLTPVCLYKRDIHAETPDYDQSIAKYSISTTTLGGEIELNPTRKTAINIGTSLNRYNPLYNNGNSIRDSLVAWDSQGGISYFINYDNKIFFDVGRKTRFPTLKELYSGYIGRNIANPNLEEETALRYEVGYTGEFKETAKFNISLFRSSVDNLIANVPVKSNLYQNQNIDKAAIQGVDTNFKIKLIKNKILLNLGYVHTDAVNKSDTRTSKDLAYIPKNKIFTGVTLNLPLSISSDISLVYVSKTHYQDNADLKWKNLGGYSLLNFGLLKKFKDRYIVFLNIQNALDKNYETFHNFPMPGININMGTKLEI
ncbi:MAG: hypothetical protein ACD_20C00347G0004 [uncultured bacterium]|nr:MAG: hypothetical protein ACD_20C00347G0004 [uncultured bacterium]HBH17594.1 hypothetical protein [Cyanobacteria bacterium UBA9579]